MERDMDKIVFESRSEIEDVMTVLTEYTETHKDEDSAAVNTSKRLLAYLDAMHLSW